MRYRGKDFNEADIDILRRLIADNPGMLRTELSRVACEIFNWRRVDGKLKDMACRVAMLQMEKDGIITLPASRGSVAARRKTVLRTPAGEPGDDIHASVGELKGIHLVRVETPSEKALWSELIDRYHYLGYKPLGGAQIRYLIKSENNILGCMGFCAAAWKTNPRDQFIGWTHEEREKNLEKVVNNARFLILPWVKVQSLASKSLAMAAKRLPGDWEKSYGYKPALLETFVEKGRFLGTCYKAANWIHVGETKGRGRYDRFKEFGQPIKAIWLYPLTRDFRRDLCRS